MKIFYLISVAESWVVLQKHLKIKGTRNYSFKTRGYCSRTKVESPFILRRFYATWPWIGSLEFIAAGTVFFFFLTVLLKSNLCPNVSGSTRWTSDPS